MRAATSATASRTSSSNNIDNPDDDSYFLCPVCGYISKGDDFESCPICGLPKDGFVEY